jgi:hypothetical protein
MLAGITLNSLHIISCSAMSKLICTLALVRVDLTKHPAQLKLSSPYKIIDLYCVVLLTLKLDSVALNFIHSRLVCGLSESLINTELLELLSY